MHRLNLPQKLTLKFGQLEELQFQVLCDQNDLSAVFCELEGHKHMFGVDLMFKNDGL